MTQEEAREQHHKCEQSLADAEQAERRALAHLEAAKGERLLWWSRGILQEGDEPGHAPFPLALARAKVAMELVDESTYPGASWKAWDEAVKIKSNLASDVSYYRDIYFDMKTQGREP